jgi:hypothetical protein
MIMIARGRELEAVQVPSTAYYDFCRDANGHREGAVRHRGRPGIGRRTRSPAAVRGIARLSAGNHWQAARRARPQLRLPPGRNRGRRRPAAAAGGQGPRAVGPRRGGRRAACNHWHGHGEAAMALAA